MQTAGKRFHPSLVFVGICLAVFRDTVPRMSTCSPQPSAGVVAAVGGLLVAPVRFGLAEIRRRRQRSRPAGSAPSGAISARRRSCREPIRPSQRLRVLLPELGGVLLYQLCAEVPFLTRRGLSVRCLCKYRGRFFVVLPEKTALALLRGSHCF